MDYSNLRIPKNTVVHCPTEELAKTVLMIAHKLGYEWYSGNSFKITTNYYSYKKNTCYNLHKGFYGNKIGFMGSNYKIISAKEFISLHRSDIEIF